MRSKNSRLSELTKLMTYHVIGNKKPLKRFTVVNHKGMRYKLRRTCATSHHVLIGSLPPDSFCLSRKRMRENDFNAMPTPTEQMVVAMAQECVDRVVEKGYRTILAGQGTSNLAAWLAYYQLAEQGVDVDLMAEIGFYGYSPRPPQPLIFNFANIATCKGVGSALDVLGIQVSGARRNECIGMLGAAIVDRFGNVDSTCVPEMKTWLLGSGGSNDVLSGAAEVIVCCPHDARRLWPEVPYITGPGKSVTALVTTKGIFRRPSEQESLTLIAVLVPPDAPDRATESLLSSIAENTGWPIESTGRVERVSAVSADQDLELLERVELRHGDPP